MQKNDKTFSLDRFAISGGIERERERERDMTPIVLEPALAMSHNGIENKRKPARFQELNGEPSEQGRK